MRRASAWREANKTTGFGWLTISGILASGCSAPYEPELQFWPGDSQGAGRGGSSSQVTGGSATSGSFGVPLAGSDVGGSAPSPAGGTASAGGSSETTAGSNVGGSSGPSGGSTTGGGGSGSTAGSSTAGSSTTGGSGSAGSAGSNSSSNCTLSVKVTTASPGGRYSPKNIGAIWIADQSGNFIRSLEVWAKARVNYLTQWNSATSKAGASGSRVDIVSQATLSSHKAHSVTWNCQDFKRAAVPDGTYRVYFEITDFDGAGPNRFEQFTKGPAPVTLKPADNNNFKALELSFQP